MLIKFTTPFGDYTIGKFDPLKDLSEPLTYKGREIGSVKEVSVSDDGESIMVTAEVDEAVAAELGLLHSGSVSLPD